MPSQPINHLLIRIKNKPAGDLNDSVLFEINDDEEYEVPRESLQSLLFFWFLIILDFQMYNEKSIDFAVTNMYASQYIQNC